MAEIRLTEPIKVSGEMVSVIPLRNPTAREIVKIGFPFVICQDGSFQPIASKILEYVVLLCDIPRKAALSISAKDFTSEAMPEVLSLLGQATETQSSDTKNSGESSHG